jgi:hypothetical protein
MIATSCQEHCLRTLTQAQCAKLAVAPSKDLHPASCTLHPAVCAFDGVYLLVLSVFTGLKPDEG